MTGAQAKCHPIRKSHAHISALQRVGIGVVHSLALGVELVGEDVVVENSTRSRQRRIAVGGGKIPAVGGFDLPVFGKTRNPVCGARRIFSRELWLVPGSDDVLYVWR